MIQYTTPTISLTVEGVDLTSQEVYVSLEQGTTELTKSGTALTLDSETIGRTTNTLISFVMSQEESASFRYNLPVNIQVNWINSSGVRSATEIKSIPVMKNLLDEVISYGG